MTIASLAQSSPHRPRHLGWTTLAGALLLGGLLGVAWGLTPWQALGRGKAFPYGPALVAGPYLALLAGATLPP